MPKDILRLKSFLPHSGKGFRGRSSLGQLPGGVLALFALVASSLLPACGGEKDDSITYTKTIRPLFNDRCSTCHRAGSPIRVDIANPFAPNDGLIASTNSWNVTFPGETLERNVVPFDPDNSFLMRKISLDGLPTNGHGGSRMPPQLPPLADDGPEIGALTQWITSGANDDTFFETEVRPIFGDVSDTQSIFAVAANGQPDPRGKCILCHYEGAPNPLDLTDPFGPDGLVNVKASYRPDRVRVVPRAPEQSFLIDKVTADNPMSEIGGQMPFSFTPLTATQIETVRQWILEGARP
jgi:hypothetical protein